MTSRTASGKEKQTLGLYRLGLIGVLVCALVFTGGVTAAGKPKVPRDKARDAALADPKQKFVPGELLVKFKAGAGPDARAAALNSQGAKVKQELRIPDLRVVKLPPGKDVHAAAAVLKGRAEVAYAEPNWIYRPTAVPNDPRYTNGELWGLNQASDADIDAPEAWDLTTGSPSVVVAVVDTGAAYDHPDLAPNIWQNPGELVDGVDNDGNGKVDDSRGWDFYGNGVTPDNDPRDIEGHGTHVAGTIGARGNNAAGVTGVNWNVSIMPVRVLGPDGGTNAMVTSGFAYAAAEGARVVNASLGCGDPECFSQAMKDAIDAAPNTLFVVAAGNDGDDADVDPHYPCSYESANLICVAATTRADALADFSNYGKASVDIAAPGTEISSTWPARSTVYTDSFEVASGWTAGGTPNTWARTNESAVYNSWSITDSPGATYLNNTSNWMTSPPISLAGRAGCDVQYGLKLDTEEGFDTFVVSGSTDNTTWSEAAAWTGRTTNYPNSWWLFTDDLAQFDGAAAFRLRLGLESDETNDDGPHQGAHVDGVNVRCISTSYGPGDYNNLQGTSMATPHVAGVAALLFAKFPAATVTEVKAAIVAGGDPLPSLSGKVVSGARLNAFNALSRSCAGKLPTLAGTPGADALVGTSDDDVILGLGGNDSIDGGGGNDRICGGPGNDSIRGGLGNDTLTGDAGIDTLDYSLAPAAVIANLQFATTTGGDGTDTLSGVENITGSGFGDTLVGNSGVNTLLGGEGNDWIRGGPSNDVLTGGNGVDMLDYAEAWPGGMTVSLATNTSSGPAGADALSGMESVVGTSSTDTITGDGGRNLLIGGPGNDTLFGGDGPDQLRGGADNDVLHGEAGVDSIDYSTAATGVTVSLVSNTATGGGGSDTFDGIESMFGSTHGDTLKGNGVNNRIDGLAGDDFLFGFEGNDVLIGAAGTDSLDGGLNTDTCLTGETLIACEP